jgi:hypothetical protein
VDLLEVLYDQPTGKLALVFECMDMNAYELVEILRARQTYIPEDRLKSYMYQVCETSARRRMLSPACAPTSTHSGVCVALPAAFVVASGAICGALRNRRVWQRGVSGEPHQPVLGWAVSVAVQCLWRGALC